MNRRKDTGSFLTKYAKSFKHGVDGINYAIEKEINIIVIMALTLLILAGCFFLNITRVELCIVVLSMGAMMAAELINCAIEAAVDLITIEKNPLAKISKDCAGAATLVLVILNFFIVGIIFIPKIIDLM